MSKNFKGRLAGVDYDQPALFEQAAKVLGFGIARRSWKPGAPVTIKKADGSRISGQVWSNAQATTEVWVALDDGTFALVSKRGGTAYSGERQRGYLGEVA